MTDDLEPPTAREVLAWLINAKAVSMPEPSDFTITIHHYEQYYKKNNQKLTIEWLRDDTNKIDGLSIRMTTNK